MRTWLVPIEVNDKTRQKLESIRHSRSQPHSLVQRAEIVLLAADGFPNQAIANTLEISPSTVRKWCRRYEEQGIKGIGFYEEVRPKSKPSPSHSDSDGTDLNRTIGCLLSLRSVRDQFADAGLDLSSGKLAQLLATLEGDLVDHLAAQREHRDRVGLLTVPVVGDFNSGKSTFINGLLGRDLCPVGEEPTTSSVTHFIHGDKELIEQQLPDGKLDPIKKPKYDSLVGHDKMGDQEPYVFHVSVNAPILEHIRLVDTPGFNAPPPNSHDTRVTEDAITGADALFVLMDARKGNLTKSLLEQLDRIQQSTEDEPCPPMFLLLNMAEELPPTDRTEVKSECKTRYGDLFRDVTLISALQLNDSDDAAPLDALQTATRQIGTAIMNRDPFETLISAKVIAETGETAYRIDIDGNVYEAPALSDSNPAFREQLHQMVKSVLAERHVLLERQFQRKTSQLRDHWQKTLSNLDYELKLALRDNTGVNEGVDGTKNKALEGIENAKIKIIDLVREVLEEVTDEIVTKDQRIGNGFWSDPTFYQLNVHLYKACKIVADHENWDRISVWYNSQLFHLKRLTGMGSQPSQKEFVRGLREKSLGLIRNFQEQEKVDFKKHDHWESFRKGYHWRWEFQNDEETRDENYDHISYYYNVQIDPWILNLSQKVIQPQIDHLQTAVIRAAERDLSRVQEKAEELDKLQKRLNELKENTP